MWPHDYHVLFVVIFRWERMSFSWLVTHLPTWSTKVLDGMACSHSCSRLRVGLDQLCSAPSRIAALIGDVLFC